MKKNEPKYVIEFREHCEKFWEGKTVKYMQELKAILAYYQHVTIEAILVAQHNMKKANPELLSGKEK